nr:hypothetical protein [Neptunomonas japonica]
MTAYKPGLEAVVLLPSAPMSRKEIIEMMHAIVIANYAIKKMMEQTL